MAPPACHPLTRGEPKNADGASLAQQRWRRSPFWDREKSAATTPAVPKVATFGQTKQAQTLLYTAAMDDLVIQGLKLVLMLGFLVGQIAKQILDRAWRRPFCKGGVLFHGGVFAL